jgi:putative endonuclease
MSSPKWWLYMIRTASGALYTGITTDVARRFREHASGRSRGARYLRGHRPIAIVLRRRIGPKSLAAKLEYQIKNLDKAHKEAIVASGRLKFNRVSGLLQIRGGTSRR